MQITVTNLKGGVGKTTVSTMLALYAVNQLNKDVLVVDFDPQAGTSSLLLGGNVEGLTIADALEQAMEGNAFDEVLQAAIRPSIATPRISVIPSNQKLSNFASNGAPIDLLDYVLKSLNLPEDILVIIDTGTTPAIVAMGMHACDGVIIPMTMSRQTIRPTANTISYLIRHKRRLVGIIPVSAGTTAWELDVLTSWRNRLAAIPEVVQNGGEVFQPLPGSKAIVRGNWISAGVPDKFLPPLSQVFQKLGLETAVPVETPPVESTEALPVDLPQAVEQSNQPVLAQAAG